MNNNQLKVKYKLEDIIRRKDEVLNDIHAQHDKITEAARNVAEPFMIFSNPKSNSLIKKFSTGIAVFDGVLLGIKIIRKFRRFFTIF